MSLLTTAYHAEAFAAGKYVRVVNWHNTPAGLRSTLRAELSWYLRRYQPLVPEDLDRFTDCGVWSLSRPGFIPVFYDGYLNNATVAAAVCDELGIPGWFMPPTEFLSVPPEDQREYARQHWIQLVPEEAEQPALAMTWDDLAMVARRHVVGVHTANHTAAKDIVRPEDVEREITIPIRQVTELTGRRPPGFAFLHGTLPDANTPAGAAVLDSGVRYAMTNTAYVRIAD